MSSRLAWSIRELAEDGCVGKSTAIYQHLAAGRLTAYKLGKRTLITDESVRTLMARQPCWKPHGKPIAPPKAAAATPDAA
jgi:hypothetical protein